MKKRMLYLMLAAIMLMQLALPLGVSAARVTYTNAENKPYVEYLRKLNAFSLYDDGNPFFEDMTAVKRHEAARALVDILGYADQSSDGSIGDRFYDVPDYYEHSGDVSLAVNLGLMQGVGGGLFAPEDPIIKIHFLKALIVAVGYEWKAAMEGGYPNGYAVTAQQLGLLDNTKGDLNSPLTREEMVRILYNVLDVPVCEMLTVADGELSYRINKDMTILNQYHDVWKGEGIVLSNKTVSLQPNFNPTETNVYIGGEKLRVAGYDEVFRYLGYEVEYFYRVDDGSSTKELLLVTPTDSNVVTTLSWRDIVSANVSAIRGYDANGKDREYKISSSASIFYNGEIITSDIATAMSNVSGNIQLIDNNDDGTADLVLINDYTYDVVTSVDITKEKIYCENGAIDLSLKGLTIQNPDGSLAAPEQLSAKTVLAIGKSRTGQNMVVVVLSSRTPITVSSTNAEGITSDEGDTYLFGKDFTDTDKLRPGEAVEVTLNQMNEIVYVFDASTSSEQIGYLMKAGSTTNAFGGVDEVALKIFSADGNVVLYNVPEKIKVDDISVKREELLPLLRQKKISQNLSSDGAISQVILYRANTDGYLTNIWTAAGGIGLVQGYNHNTQGTIELLDNGYGTGTFGAKGSPTRNYAISTKGIVFRVPEVDQESQPDTFYSLTSYSKNNTPSGCKLESYMANADDLEPIAYVLYPKDFSTARMTGSESFFLVQNVMRTVNADGGVCSILDGYIGGKKKTYEVDSSVTLPNDLEAGDVLTFYTDGAGIIQEYRKIYDVGTNRVEYEPYLNAELNSNNGVVRLYHIYYAPEGSNFLEAYKVGFDEGIPGDEQKMMLTIKNYKSTNSGPLYFNRETETAAGTTPERIVDYKMDPENYAVALVRYYGNGYEVDMVIID